MTFTPKFIAFCSKYSKLNPLASNGDIRPFLQSDADTLLKDLVDENLTIDQLNVVHRFATKVKADLEEYSKIQNLSAAKQKEIVAYNQFLETLEKKLKQMAEQQNNQTTGNSAQTKPNTSYKPAAATGQSLYDSVINSFGYDPTVVGASAMFYLAFSALRFLLATPYWEQAAEYTDADPSKRFDPEKITTEQTEKLLHAKSTPEEVLQAGFIPKPDLAHALEVEFKNVARKMGGDNMSQKQGGEIPNLLRYNVNNRAR